MDSVTQFALGAAVGTAVLGRRIGLRRAALSGGLLGTMPEVLEFHRMAGEVVYPLKVLATDMKTFDAFYKHLIETTGLTEVTSRFSMETIKETTALPI